MPDEKNMIKHPLLKLFLLLFLVSCRYFSHTHHFKGRVYVDRRL